MKKEGLGSRAGFILVCAGCAIGLGNVWRFPYTVGKYGGALFLILYLVLLAAFALPIMVMEFAVGRASGENVAGAFVRLAPGWRGGRAFGMAAMAGNYLLLMFYTNVTGWMAAYFLKMLRGDFAGRTAEEISAQFDAFTTSPAATAGFMLIAAAAGFAVCARGLRAGAERVTKLLMPALMAIIVVIAVRTCFLPGAGAGLRYYLIPSVDGVRRYGWAEVLSAALAQAFFTLSVGMGSMGIFASHIGKDKRLAGEAVLVALLDTFVAVAAGFAVIPACFAAGESPGAGPGLIFRTLPHVFNSMSAGRVWGSLFFLFMVFAAMSTVIGVSENITSFGMNTFGMTRAKSCAVNAAAVALLSLPCAFGYNILSFIAPLGAGTTILDLEDFIVSGNILPLGSLVYVIFCTGRRGWGWGNFVREANTGEGLAFPRGLRVYCSVILPVLLLILWVQGFISLFLT